MASDNSSSHYRVLKEHTPTSHSPPQGLSPADLVLTIYRHPVSGATLPAYQTISTTRKPEVRRPEDIQQPHTTRPRHKVSDKKYGGGLREARSPLPVRTLSGPPGRRRGALTRRKLRNRIARVKSPGHLSMSRTSPQVKACRRTAKHSAACRFSSNRPM